jgi:hypothetical protein
MSAHNGGHLRCAQVMGAVTVGERSLSTAAFRERVERRIGAGVSCAGCIGGRMHISQFWRFGIGRRDCEDGTWESRSNRSCSRFAAAGGRVQYWRFGPRWQGDYGVMFWLMWNRLPGSYARLT